MSTPAVVNVQWKHLGIRLVKKPPLKFGNKVPFGKRVMKHCKVYLMESVAVYGRTPECLKIVIFRRGRLQYCLTRSLYLPADRPSSKMISSVPKCNQISIESISAIDARYTKFLTHIQINPYKVLQRKECKYSNKTRTLFSKVQFQDEKKIRVLFAYSDISNFTFD